jgi:hypothetical protein
MTINVLVNLEKLTAYYRVADQWRIIVVTLFTAHLLL